MHILDMQMDTDDSKEISYLQHGLKFGRYKLNVTVSACLGVTPVPD